MIRTVSRVRPPRFAPEPPRAERREVHLRRLPRRQVRDQAAGDPPSVQPMCWCPNAYSTPGTREEGPITGNASGNVGRNPSQSFSRSRAPASTKTRRFRFRFWGSRFYARRAARTTRASPRRAARTGSPPGRARKPPSSTSPAARTPPAMGVTMNPPSEEHTGRVSNGIGRSGVDVFETFSQTNASPGAHCTLYPRSVSSGTRSPHCSASAAECAPAAMTTARASVCAPSAVVTLTTEPPSPGTSPARTARARRLPRTELRRRAPRTRRASRAEALRGAAGTSLSRTTRRPLAWRAR